MFHNNSKENMPLMILRESVHQFPFFNAFSPFFQRDPYLQLSKLYSLEMANTEFCGEGIKLM
jgi:hypothetical protein